MCAPERGCGAISANTLDGVNDQQRIQEAAAEDAPQSVASLLPLFATMARNYSKGLSQWVVSFW
jgi:hypothetical protein